MTIKKPRILGLSYLFPNRSNPNYGIFVLNRLKAVSHYCDIRVVAPIPWFPFMERFARYKGLSRVPKKETIKGIQVQYPKFPVIPRYMKWLDSITLFLATVPFVCKMRGQFDLIDVHWVYPDILAGFIYAKIYQKPILVTVRGLEALHLNEKSFRKKIIDFLLPRVDRVITLSDELSEFAACIGVERCKVTTILNGVDTSQFRRLDQTACRKLLGLPKDKKIVVCVGSLLLSKGYDELLEIMPNLSREFDIELYIIGGIGQEGDDSLVLKEMVGRLQLEDVHFTGGKPHEQLPYWYNAADVFCHASRSEGCPNVIMEALACGTPVVVRDVGAVRDIVDTETKGVIFGSRRHLDLETALRRVLTKAWDRKLIESLMQNFTWEACAKQVLSVYRQVFQDSVALAVPQVNGCMPGKKTDQGISVTKTNVSSGDHIPGASQRISFKRR